MKDYTKPPAGTTLDLSVKSEDFDLTRRLKATLHQYIKLYERWSEDRQEWTKQLVEVSDEFIRFENALNNFEEIDKKFRSSLKTFIQNEVEELGDKINESISATVNDFKTSMHDSTEKTKKAIENATSEEVRKCIIKLEAGISNANISLNQAIAAYNQEANWQFWKTLLFSVMGSIVASMVVFFIFVNPLPSRVISLTDQQMKYLANGRAMANIWSKLPKTDQDKIQKLADESDNFKTDISKSETNY